VPHALRGLRCLAVAENCGMCYESTLVKLEGSLRPAVGLSLPNQVGMQCCGGEKVAAYPLGSAVSLRLCAT
jgi:hypothetical protein